MKLADINIGVVYATAERWPDRLLVLDKGWHRSGRYGRATKAVAVGQYLLTAEWAGPIEGSERAPEHVLTGLAESGLEQFASGELTINGWRPVLVLPRAIGKTWEEHKADKAKAEEHNQRVAREREERRDKAKAEGESLVRRAGDLGVTVEYSVNSHGYLSLHVAPSALEQLLQAAERAS